MKIVDYKILSDTNCIAVQREVVEYIQDGWQPYGSISISKNEYGTTYAQPVVKYAIPEGVYHGDPDNFPEGMFTL